MKGNRDMTRTHIDHLPPRADVHDPVPSQYEFAVTELRGSGVHAPHLWLLQAMLAVRLERHPQLEISL